VIPFELEPAMSKVDFDDSVFSDADDIGSWAFDAVMSCARARLIAGFGDGCFRPAGVLSRADAAVMLGRVSEFLRERSYIDSMFVV